MLRAANTSPGLTDRSMNSRLALLALSINSSSSRNNMKPSHALWSVLMRYDHTHTMNFYSTSLSLNRTHYYLIEKKGLPWEPRLGICPHMVHVWTGLGKWRGNSICKVVIWGADSKNKDNSKEGVISRHNHTYNHLGTKFYKFGNKYWVSFGNKSVNNDEKWNRP